ncbi:hypothetical protein Y032_0002g624 [Ancylostoma ceylanicum]|uniref:Uncharacterized protein n=1 Tax=Ancylostoma ceylanicum TaxID=53326 RepID=A0A016VZY7_9BILA|nr:hypothetical protein Y032_0002g624 [Ancylostoma ceylanicum]
MQLIGLGFKVFYIVVPFCGITGNVLLLTATGKYKETLCTITSSLQGLPVYDAFSDILMAVNVAVLAVYAVFLIRVRKVVVGPRAITRRERFTSRAGSSCLTLR